MVAPEVGEHRRREAGAVDATEGERVRGDLHRHRPLPVAGELRQTALQVGGFRRRVGAGKRADDAARQRGGLEDGGEQVRRGRLAVRAGDAHDRQPVRRVVEDRGGDRSGGGPDVVDHDLGHAHVEHVVDDERRRAGVDGLLGEEVTVDVLAADAAEDGARGHRSRVVGDVPHERRSGSPTTRCTTGARAALQHRREICLVHCRYRFGQPPVAVGGAMSSSRTAVWAICVKTGEATVPPKWAPPAAGSSIETRIVI